MVTAVLDTNVLASGFVGFERRASTPGELLRLWTYDAFELIASEPILAELERTFQDRYFSTRLSPERRANNIQLLRTKAEIIDVTQEVTGIASHPEDDLILATALSASADYLVTGDHPLQAHASYRGVRIVSPRAFLEILTAGA